MRKKKNIHLPRELFMYVSQNVSRETIQSSIRILPNENKLFINSVPEIRGISAFDIAQSLGYL